MLFTLMDMVFLQGLEWTKELRTMMLLFSEGTCNKTCYGKSVHNQRIECLWRDVFQGVSCTYYYMFYHLEYIGLLNPLVEEDLFTLHYVFLNIINQHLSRWMHSWNNHKMSSCNGKTPMQMWIEGWQRMNGSGSGNVHWSNCK